MLDVKAIKLSGWKKIDPNDIPKGKCLISRTELNGHIVWGCMAQYYSSDEWINPSWHHPSGEEIEYNQGEPTHYLFLDLG